MFKNWNFIPVGSHISIEFSISQILWHSKNHFLEELSKIWMKNDAIWSM